MLLTPKDWWHVHDEHQVCTEQHTDSSMHAIDDDCFVCDFVIQPAIVPLSFQFNFPAQAPIVAVQIALGFVYCSKFPTHSLRGPPTKFNC